MNTVHKAIWYDVDDVVRTEIQYQAIDIYYDVFDDLLVPMDNMIYDRFTAEIRFALVEKLEHEIR